MARLVTPPSLASNRKRLATALRNENPSHHTLERALGARRSRAVHPQPWSHDKSCPDLIADVPQLLVLLGYQW
jgi:hypothetical protein